MNSAIGIIFGNMNSSVLQGLAQDRPIAAVPFGGRYRLLDFALSSMVNSGIRTVGLITPQQYRPMLDHLGAGKDWSLDRKSGGLFILPGVIHSLGHHTIRFSLRDIANNIDFLEKDCAKNVIISSSDQVFNLDFRPILEHHERAEADITLVYNQSVQPLEEEDIIYLKMKPSEKVTAMTKNKDMAGLEGPWPYFIDLLIIRRELLLQMIEGYGSIETIELSEVIAQHLGSLSIQGYFFGGYAGRIRSVKDYFLNNMALLQEEIRQDLFRKNRPIRTKIRDNPPTKFGKRAQVENSLISSGCTIEGKVVNAILSRGVVIEEGCEVQNCIIMSKCTIGRNSRLENLIMDKFVEVNEGSVLQGRTNKPMVISKKAVI
ncbi:glucose-1-phosphate adenylyltransferase, GlgD subunit [Desulfitobacterium dehalogenans ATCC 51507]|uniref:Glucose-1-phosphate adenylyltransferase, GlgD subunit n=2 Tax=Desulfitobacterium dehalogenans TaxID=36854 RepID=I4AAI4_DESDJ|nr:glucose-1-phosphate adenylyltransferase subunit GlgD [Desulfitobacterium dehalogenans]AFM00969.1 glucose-1-phosphate adenylyltransferase, GlgD subunit [Desulfitobacterium dehalogenans ATCC 51507]